MLETRLVAIIRYWHDNGSHSEEEIVFEPHNYLVAPDKLSLELAYDENENHRELISVREWIDGVEVTNSPLAKRVMRSANSRAEALMNCYDDIEEDTAWNKANNKWS